MKRALVFMVLVCTLSLVGFAQLSGTWDAKISIDPGATIAGNLFVDLSTTIDLDYTVCGWVFGATAGFDRLGWSTMKFAADGALGAFTFTGVMNFKPRTITAAVCTYPVWTGTVLLADFVGPYTSCWYGDDQYIAYTYGAAFDDLMFTAALSIAGVDLEGLFFLNDYAGDKACAPLAFYFPTGGTTPVQTSGDTTHYLGAAASATGTGSGFRFGVSGSMGCLELESLTYFSLNEPFAKTTCGYSLDKKGSGFTVSTCTVGFTEQYFHIDGFEFGCAIFEIGLDITCSGFQWIAIGAHDIDLGVWGLMGDFYVKFTELQKSVDFCLDFDLDTVCFDIGVTLDYEDYVVNGFSIDSIVLETDLGGVTFTSTTYFDGCISTVTDEAYEILFLVPYTGMKDGALATSLAIPSIDSNGVGYYTAYDCMYTEKWCVWETFLIEVDGDSCCGGAFDFSIETGMGTQKELDAFAWDYQFDKTASATAVDVHNSFLYTALETGDAVPTVASVTGGTDLNGDGVVDLIDYTTVVGAVAAEQLLVGSVYEDATSDSLFSWVYTNVDLSIGLGANWDLTFGAEIDVYGWNELYFGFAFSF